MTRAQNAKRNGVWEGVHKSISLTFPFFIKRLIVIYLGANYLGLNAFFTSVLGFLNIFDLGIGNAIVFVMYKPIADNDDKKVCSLLNLFKRINTIIGLTIFIFGLVLMPFLKFFIKGGIPNEININLLFLIYLMSTCSSYLVCGHQINLLFALQRNDVVRKIDSFLTVVLYLIEIAVIILAKNYYLYEFFVLLHTVSRGIFANKYVNRYYPQYVARGTIDKQTKNIIKDKTLGLFVSKIASLSKNSFDSIVISSFIGLGTLAVFNNYYLVVNSVMLLLSVFTTSITSVVGNSIATESSLKNYNDYRRLNFLLIIIITTCASLMINLYQPFMKLWVGSDLRFDTFTMMMFPVYYFFLAITQVQNIYIDASGLWDEKKKYALMETFTNIILNIVLCCYIGVKGIIFASIITIVIFDLYIYAKILFRKLFHQSFKKHILKQVAYIFIGITVVIISFYLLNLFTIKNIILRFLILPIFSVLTTFTMLFIAYRRTNVFTDSLEWICGIFGVQFEAKRKD